MSELRCVALQQAGKAQERERHDGTAPVCPATTTQERTSQYNDQDETRQDKTRRIL